MDVNGVAVAPYGVKLGQDGATDPTGNLFGIKLATWDQKMRI